MQFLSIDRSMTLSKLSSRVGSRNVDAILNLNSLTRSPDIGNKFYTMSEQRKAESSEVSYQRKISILNSLTKDSDVFETAALLNSDEWKILSFIGTLPGMLAIPEMISIQDGADVLGNGVPIERSIYIKAMGYLQNNKDIDPVVFNEYNAKMGSQIVDTSTESTKVQWFHLPWGMISLHSSIDDAMIDIPVYPEGFSDDKRANFDTMPDMLYQYEPWQV